MLAFKAPADGAFSAELADEFGPGWH
jgi:hypothetical protein